MLERLDTVIAFSVVMLGVSLLITVLVQMMATFLSLRGTNLRWGLIQLITTVHPDVAAQADNVVNRVLRHPLISDSAMSRFNRLLGRLPIANRWTLASTIRLDELIGILRKLGEAGGGDATRAAMAKIADAARAAVNPEVKMLAERVNTIRTALAKFVPPAEQEKPAAQVELELQIDKLLESIPTKIEGGFDDLKSWFDAAMDRAAQRFSLHARTWTVTFSILVAFALHLDGFRFLSELASNPDMRASLVASADAMSRNADALLAEQRKNAAPAPNATPPAPRSGKSVVPGVYRDEMAKMAAVGTPFQAEQPYFANREEAMEWMRKALKGDPKTDDLIKEYQANVDQQLVSDDDKMLDRAASIKGILNRAKFQLIPDPYHSWDFFPWSPAPFQATNVYQVWNWKNLHFWGILFSSALLSLGAPFWFNALKNLSGLRPIIAGKQDKEQK